MRAALKPDVMPASDFWRILDERLPPEETISAIHRWQAATNLRRQRGHGHMRAGAQPRPGARLVTRAAVMAMLFALAAPAWAQFTIPNYPTATYPALAAPDGLDFLWLGAGERMNGVTSGAACTAQGSPDMTVAVSAGATIFNYTVSAVTSGNATITTADGTNPRFDVVVSAAGTKTVRAGTAAANPVYPTLTAGDVPLCVVWVPANDTTIASDQIVDKRIFVAGFKTLTFLNAGSSYTTPIGARMLVIECVGGGAGGGGVTGVGSQTATGGGGGGGSYSMAILSGGSLSTTYSYSIGAAANGGSAGNNAGTAGNDTTFNTSTCVGKGGGAGGGQAASATAKGSGTPGAGGVAGTGSVMTTVGYPAHPGWSGGAAGVMGSPGGDTFFGGGAVACVVAAAGTSASGCGGGGGGGCSTAAVNRAGGNGAAGCIRITEVY